MAKEDFEATLLTAALGEELQMIDVYSQMIEVTKSEDTRRTLSLLISESREHAFTASELLLELSSKYSWELEDIDRKVAEQTAKNFDFKLSKEAIAWYKEKIGGLADSSMEDVVANMDTTKQATIFALDIFIGSERTAYNLYDIISRRIKGPSQPIITKIKEDELRHANMLNELIWVLKKGKKEEKPRKVSMLGGDASNVFYCAVCEKLYRKGLKECESCGEELKKMG
jgi:rubrerythrin